MKKEWFFPCLLIVFFLTIVLWYSQKKSVIPHLTLTSINNHTIKTEALKNKVVLIHFFATSCPTCMQEMPQLATLYHHFVQQEFELIAIAMPNDPPSYLFNYLQQHPLPFFVTIDKDGEIAKAFGGVNLLPTFILIDKKGKIVHTLVGTPHFIQLQSTIATLLAQ